MNAELQTTTLLEDENPLDAVQRELDGDDLAELLEDLFQEEAEVEPVPPPHLRRAAQKQRTKERHDARKFKSAWKDQL